jgi:nitrous oxide reductase accessory protein NosL
MPSGREGVFPRKKLRKRRSKMRYIFILLLSGLYLSVHEEGGSPQGESRVKLRPKCIVCGMYADMDTLWMSEVELQNGAKLFFESPLHAFQFYLNPQKYTRGSVERDDIVKFLVRDYSSGRKIRADSLLFLVNSDIKGPMGKDLVPVNKRDAEKLRKKHGGNIMKFSEITEEFIKDYSKAMDKMKGGKK